MNSPAATRFGRFQLHECVSSSGMGEVFRVGVGGKRSFALKRLPADVASDPVLSGMFIDEARIAASVVGKNLTRLIEHGDVDGQHYLLFEWIDGVTLEELLATLAKRKRLLPVDQTARLFSEIAEALDRLHATRDANDATTGLVHRDLSPSNVLIDFHGHPHILDFGLSRSTLQLSQTQPGFVKGKVGYLAPEQLSGDADQRTDLFALGICLYETLTGRRLFERPTIDGSIQAIRGYGGVSSSRPIRDDIPEALDEVVSKLLAAAPDARIQSASEARRAILGAMPSVQLAGDTLSEGTGRMISALFPARAPKPNLPGESERTSATHEEAPSSHRSTIVLVILAIGLGSLVGALLALR